MSRVLAILEVSQKQAFIFSSNKLKDNIENSDIIAWITSANFIEQVVDDKNKFDRNNNLVYAGGGHTILEFEDEVKAKEVISIVTRDILGRYPDVELFATLYRYDEEKNAGENIKELIRKLEKKKSMRKASFHQGTFGIEKIDTNTGNAIIKNTYCKYPLKKLNMPKRESYVPDGYSDVMKFEDLGGSEGDSNFIAVVHIDGNGMGKRVEEFENKYKNWNDYKESMRKFSASIAKDFIGAYRDMLLEVAEFLKTETAADTLELKIDNKEKKLYFPVRRIITEGDDICFVSEGRIGIECARIFLEKLSKKINSADGKNYSACAGVAIVHQKYPFYRAYELAEALCSKAKRFGADISAKAGISDNGSSISSIDWHIEYGELKDTIEELRKNYETADGMHLEMRPYIVKASDAVMKCEPIRVYRNFKSLIKKILADKDFYASGALKELRPALKKGETSAIHYLKYHHMEQIYKDGYQGIYKEFKFEDTKVGSGEELEGKLFIDVANSKDEKNAEYRCTVFDAIEAMDTFVLIGEE